MMGPWWTNAAVIVAALSLQDPVSDRAPLMVDGPICSLSRGAYCVLQGEGETTITRRGASNLVRIRFGDDGQDILISEPSGCRADVSNRPYIASIDRRGSRITLVFRLHARCDLRVSVPDHHSDQLARGIVIGLTQIQMCLTSPCEGRPLATLISRRALGWPD